MILIGVVALTTFLIVFVNLGKLTGKTTVDNAADVVLIYVGSSIVALSIWLQGWTGELSEAIGQESFWGLRYLISMVFPGLLDAESKFLEFVYFPNGGMTNIFTGFRSYLLDFGWVGLAVIMFCIGVAFSVGYTYVKKNTNSLNCILLGFFYYNFVYLLFTPSITSNLFTSSQIFGIMWILIMNKILLKPSYIIKA